MGGNNDQPICVGTLCEYIFYLLKVIKYSKKLSELTIRELMAVTNKLIDLSENDILLETEIKDLQEIFKVEPLDIHI